MLSQPNSLLAHIYLAGNYIGNSGIKDLEEGLRKNDKIIDIDVTNNDIRGNEGALNIAKILMRQGNQI